MTYDPIEHTVAIDAPPEAVWHVLTDPAAMARWLGEPQMEVEVVPDWRDGGSLRIRGFHHARFENRGAVHRYDPPRRLCYTQLSSLSRLADEPQNHTVFDFRLRPEGSGTVLTLHISGFPTESIFKHLAFYWRVTVNILKQRAERAAQGEGAPGSVS